MATTELPKLPAAHNELANYIASNPDTPLTKLMAPYREFEAHLREVYAQDRSNPLLTDPYLNVLPLFTKDTPNIKTRARNLDAESEEEKGRYIMALPEDKRRAHGSPAVVENLKEFRNNFSIFSESSLADMNWDNVVAAGSSVVNCILPVPAEYKKSKRALRQYYHEKFCPASDVDLFLYGLNEEEAIEKIKDIEARIKDAILSETTVVRTKNAITICSQYPTRHIQIVLRVYKSISEILTGFDIDCACAAYDGSQVYCVPRALASYITQINPIDLSRRSPSYENRLSKYSHRNFEVYWPELDRSRVDPTIYERSFQRTLGLARLLVLERLPTTNAREQYQRKRREERGRPELGARFQHRLFGNIKDNHEDEVADWVGEDEVSNYHTFTVPYGARFNAKKIEKLCYTKDLLLNAEWNQQKDRKVYLHRHPAFFGRVIDVIGDCCGTCPSPVTTEEKEIAEKESEIYCSGNVSFRIDDPGRQQIGSFNPLTEDDWTEMAYVGNTARLCQAIVDGDLEHVEDWLAQEGADPNTRDYTGRTPLHLAVTSSTVEIVKCLVDHGARLVARLADGQTALHLAAARGNVEMVKLLLEKSNANEEEEEDKLDQRRKARDVSTQEPEESSIAKEEETDSDAGDEDGSDGELIGEDDISDDGVQSAVTGSFVKLAKDDDAAKKDEAARLDDDSNDPDFYKIDVVAWDSKCSPLHLAILGGHCDVVKVLCQEFGADVLLPVKIGDGSYSDPHNAILTLVLALSLPLDRATEMAKTLLSLGATSSQADAQGVTAFHRFVKSGGPALVDILYENDANGLKTAVGHIAMSGSSWNPKATAPLNTAIAQGNSVLVLKLLEAGAKPQIDFDTWLKSAKFSFDKHLGNFESNQEHFRNGTDQPLITAIRSENPAIALELLERGADPNVLTKSSWEVVNKDWARRYNKGRAAIDVAKDSLEKLRRYRGEKLDFNKLNNKSTRVKESASVVEAPKGPIETDSFLSRFDKDTYQHWAVSSDIQYRVRYHEKELERFEKDRAAKANAAGLKEKQEAIDDLIAQLERVVSALEAKGAKSFKEQYPEIQDKTDSIKSAKDESQTPYQFEFNFNGVKDLTEARKAAYIELFEACWRGDIEGIKKYTLTSWDGEDKESPLQIAVSDNKSNNPFSLAFLRGHWDAAKAVLEIAQAQWTPKEAENARYKMTRDDDEEDSCEDSDAESGDEPEVYKEVVIDQVTIDNIGQISMQVNSHVLPTTMLEWAVPVMTGVDGQPHDQSSSYYLLHYAIAKGDLQQFKFLVDLYAHYTTQQPADDDDGSDGARKVFVFPVDRFNDVIKYGRTDMLTEIIKTTGAGLPFDELVKKSGTEMKTKPRYYQGLSVYGKKRADWANAGRNLVVKPTGPKASPLLTAAMQGSLTSLEWFASDTPLRYYTEFGSSKAAQGHPSVKHLRAVEGRFDRAIAKWLGMQSDLVLHCAVMGPLKDEQNRLIEYLTKTYPSSLETKSNEGYTPLFLAFLLGRVEYAKILIDAQADISVKDKKFNNLIHAALTNKPEKADRLRKLLELLEPDMRSHLFMQRNGLAHGGDTPLHFWLQNANQLSYRWQYNDHYGSYRSELGAEDKTNVQILKALLDISKGQELEILNSAGNTILHTAVLRQIPVQMALIIDANPKLLFRENAVGRTPPEIAYDRYIHEKVSSVTPIEDNVVDLTDLPSKEPSYFLHKVADKHKKFRTRKELTWEVCAQHLDKHKDGAKRRLVSLNEANDVAIRIGESYTGQRYFQKTPVEPADADEGEDEEAKKKREEEEAKREADISTIKYGETKHSAWATLEESKDIDDEAGDPVVCPDCGTAHD
ncbi:uncharacterized protein B0I36DRAFT_273482 [Microdochium trichocladiopsis]|uniref:Ankyrin repeat protein n=1 Tax=Microdochium trichocladiopsis TaxID=1682393 RepID=A0A9P8Y2S5_9PEZI|nr:uncharacterized protein B0I36DRAFT_273482 [Microdochium trichocladiopsis]KAH7026489.1 hypothetical protein B0I36DRAFT_273482 [Microdochium trichocladiopsis]